MFSLSCGPKDQLRFLPRDVSSSEVQVVILVLVVSIAQLQPN